MKICDVCGKLVDFLDTYGDVIQGFIVRGHKDCVLETKRKVANGEFAVLSTSALERAWAPNPPASTVKGVDPNAPLETLESGARQSKSPYRFDLLDPAAMFKLTELIANGAEKYGVDNWRAIPVDSHLNHMLVHAYAYLAGDTSDDHLTHMLARALFAVAVKEQIERERVTE